MEGKVAATAAEAAAEEEEDELWAQAALLCDDMERLDVRVRESWEPPRWNAAATTAAAASSAVALFGVPPPGSMAREVGSAPPMPRDHGLLQIEQNAACSFRQLRAAARPWWGAAAVSHRRRRFENPTVHARQQQALFTGGSDAMEEKMLLYNYKHDLMASGYGRHRQYYDHGLHDYGTSGITRGQNRSSRITSDSMISVESSDELVRMIRCCTTWESFDILRNIVQPWFHPSTMLGLAMDSNRVRVVRAFVQSFPSENAKFIFDAVAHSCITIACYPNGLCLLQDCLVNFNRMEKDHICTKVSYSSFHLAHNAYGNYIVQDVLKERDPSHLAIISSCFRNHYVELSREKYSSNVVETCLKNFGGQEQMIIVNELISYPYFEDLVTDEFANYVISTALQTCKAPLQQTLAMGILSLRNVNRCHPHCLKIYGILSKYGYI